MGVDQVYICTHLPQIVVIISGPMQLTGLNLKNHLSTVTGDGAIPALGVPPAN